MKSLLTKNIFIDTISLIGLFATSLFLISFYFSASNINITYPDWMSQAFRVRELELHGMTSWTHVWSNGIDFWKSYQFIPQFITLGVVKVFHVSITRAMVLLVIAQFVLLRLVVYIVARLLKFSPFVSFIAAVATFSIAYFWKAVGDYSLLFTFTFFPLILFVWVKYLEGRCKYFYPYLAGVMFYVHPLLGLISAAMLVFAQFFSTQKIFSKNTLLQAIIFLIASSLFWVPIIFKQSYTSGTAYLATKEFLQLSLSPLPYYGLSISLFILFALCIVEQFFSVSKEYRWGKILFFFLFLYFLLIYIGVRLPLPAFINQLQYTRGVGLLGIGIIFAILPLIQRILQSKSLFPTVVITAIVTVIFVEGMWITSLYAPGTLATSVDPVSVFQKRNVTIDLKHNRVWTPTIELSSYYGAPDSVRFPTSYMAHLEPNQLPERLDQLITYRPFLENIPFSESNRINDYFKLAGVKYVVIDEGSMLTPIFTNSQSGYKNLGRIILSGGVYHAFEAPWDVKNAVLVSVANRNILTHFPFGLQMQNPVDQIALDSYVHNFASMIYDPANTKLSVEYPTEESLVVTIPPQVTKRDVVINESYDTQWIASLNNAQQTIEPVGPNFMLVHLPATKGGNLIFTHTRPFHFFVSVALIIAIPCILFIQTINQKFRKILRRKTVKERSKT